MPKVARDLQYGNRRVDTSIGHFVHVSHVQKHSPNLQKAIPRLAPNSLPRLLDSLVSIANPSDNRALASALEELDLRSTVAQLRADHLVQRFLDVSQQDRKASIDGLVRLVDSLSDDERQALQAALQKPRPSGKTNCHFHNLGLTTNL